jgi:hypothetical protein
MPIKGMTGYIGVVSVILASGKKPVNELAV